MKPPPQAKLATQSTKLCLFRGSSSYQDADVMEVSIPSSSWTLNNRKRKRNQVIPHEIIDMDEDDDPEVVFIGGSTSDYKNKQPIKFCKGLDMQLKDDLSNVGSSKNHMFDNVALPPLDTLKSSKPVSHDFNFADGCDYDDYDDGYGYDDYDERYAEFEDRYDYDDYEDGYDYGDYEDDYYEGFEFDSDRGVNNYNYSLSAKFDGLDVPRGVEANVPWLQQPALEKPTRTQPKTVVDDAIDLKFKAFKQFDTVQGDYDHYYAEPEYVRGIKTVKKPSKDWAKRIQNEWKVMEKDLPGAAGSPYHDGLFFFDAYFPPSYPRSPPMVHYRSGGLEPNPNLHACGTVCLSLLGTWSGRGCENWSPANSTMLQVLVSIQALVMNAKPYFNWPGYEESANMPQWEKQSLIYNEKTFLLSCRTMLYSLRRPPKHFEDFVAGYFRKCGHAILVACRAYLCGAQVGCLVGGGVQDVDEGEKNCSEKFRNSLKMLYDELLMEFTVKGADCDEFSSGKVRDGSIGAADTTLRACWVTRNRKERKKVGKYVKTKIEINK